MLKIFLQWKGEQNVFHDWQDYIREKGKDSLFSPEKHLLINKMEETGKASELIWLKNSDTNDVVVTVYMLVDEIEP